MPVQSITVEARPARDRVFLVCRGELDHFTASVVREAVAELVASGWQQIVLDLSELDFMDAGGLHLLIDARDGVLGAGEYSMVDGHAAVSLPIELAGGGRLLPQAELAP